MIIATTRVFRCHAEMTEALARAGFLYLFLCFKASRAEEQTCALEHRMVELTAEEQNKEKEWLEMRTVSETSGTTLTTPLFEL